MPVPEELERELTRELHEEFEKHLEEVRGCPMTPGSLEKIMTRGAQRMARLTQQALAKAASQEADFPPSALSAMRPGTSVPAEDATEACGDGVGRDPV